jgi:hypothetical protein
VQAESDRPRSTSREFVPATAASEEGIDAERDRLEKPASSEERRQETGDRRVIINPLAPLPSAPAGAGRAVAGDKIPPRAGGNFLIFPEKERIFPGKEVFGGRKEVFAGEKEVFAGGKDVFGARKDVFGARKDVFGARKDVFVGEKEIFVAGKEVFAAEKEVFCAGKGVFAEGKEVISATDGARMNTDEMVHG